MHDEILGLVVLASGEVGVEDGLGAGGVSLEFRLVICSRRLSTGSRAYLLSIDGGAGHVRNHGVASTPGVGGIAERVVLGSGLGEPDVTSVAAEVAGLEGLGDVLLDDDGATGCVDEPGAW